MSIKALYPSSLPSLNLDFVNSGAVDPRITFTRASSATVIDRLGVLRLVGQDVPRLDYDPSTLAARGLLIEEQRTNGIRNNTMVGAAAGTPGTLPTNWVVVGGGLGTLTQTIVGVGTSNGINYIDLRVNGTTSTTSYGLGFDAFTQVAASASQTWTGSVYVAMVFGSTANISQIFQRVIDRDAAGANLGSSSVDFMPTLSSTLTRVSLTRTLAGVGTANVSNDILFAFSSGVAIDITLRIGLPQLEQGAFATSAIPTTTAAATRAADVATMTGANFSNWYRQDEGTLFVEAGGAQGAGSLFSTDDGTASNRVITYFNVSNSPALRIVTGGVEQANFSAGTIAQNATFKLSAGYKVNDFAASLNGAASVTDTSGTVATGQNTARLGMNVSSATHLNGYLRRIAYFPTRLTNAQLQAVTA